MTAIRVLIADDHAIVRSGLVRMVELTEGMEVIAKQGQELRQSSYSVNISPMSR